MPKVGIVVLNFNTFNETVNCIESIKELTTVDYKIYLVDNKSTEECRSKLTEQYADDGKVEILLAKENLGYSGGNNIGARKALDDKSKYIMFVNSDVIFCNDVVKHLIEGLNKEVVLSGPNVTNLDGTDGQQMMQVYTFWAALFDRQPFYSLAKHFKFFDYHIKPTNDEMVFSGMVGGCCFMIEAKPFEKIGLFDDNVFLYSEERILGIKLYKQGYKVAYRPNAKIIHAEGKSTGRVNAFADYHRYASDYYCIVKYISPCNFGRKVLKYMRLLNFKIKAVANSEYKSRYVQLKNKFKEIENGNYKITF